MNRSQYVARVFWPLQVRVPQEFIPPTTSNSNVSSLSSSSTSSSLSSSIPTPSRSDLEFKIAKFRDLKPSCASQVGSGYLIGWNVRNLVVCVATIIPAVPQVSLAYLEKCISVLSQLSHLSEEFKKCAGVPTIIGFWYGPNLNFRQTNQTLEDLVLDTKQQQQQLSSHENEKIQSTISHEHQLRNRKSKNLIKANDTSTTNQTVNKQKKCF